ncbi:hypothetical protein AB6A40_009902 [Gnathostoma spinigerum]|uniref:Uncharacterized protein n=1 Tax=Gnathostoma spinigerum TaxID=75299 RepID=A0ABD6ETQ0_9BILA
MESDSRNNKVTIVSDSFPPIELPPAPVIDGIRTYNFVIEYETSEEFFGKDISKLISFQLEGSGVSLTQQPTDSIRTTAS